MNFWDRLWCLTVSMLCLFLGIIVGCYLHSLRGMGSGIVLDAAMINQLTGIKIFAAPTVVAIIGLGLWGFYQALKE